MAPNQGKHAKATAMNSRDYKNGIISDEQKSAFAQSRNPDPLEGGDGVRDRPGSAEQARTVAEAAHTAALVQKTHPAS